MTWPIFLLPQASQDVHESRDYFETRQAGLGEVFLDRLNEVLARIRDMPKIYGVAWRNVRAARLRRFTHVVYYRLENDRVEVLAVMHAGRDAKAWRGRARR